MIDPGANHAYFNSKIATGLKRKQKMLNKPITNLANGSQVTVYKTAEKITPLYNYKMLISYAFVIDLLDHHCFVGMDMFSCLGNFISGANNPLSDPTAQFEGDSHWE
jgi:hypothetical protein